MNAKELRKKTAEELERTLHETRQKMQRMRFDIVSGKVKNVRELRELKKTVARLLTIRNEQH